MANFKFQISNFKFMHKMATSGGFPFSSFPAVSGGESNSYTNGNDGPPTGSFGGDGKKPPSISNLKFEICHLKCLWILLFINLPFTICHLQCRPAEAAESGKISPTEKGLYEESIRSTKQTIARETLDVFYRDAVDFYRDRRYGEALELLDKIYSVDPHYEDVQTLRNTILKTQSNRQLQSVQEQLSAYMRKGNKAFSDGQPVLAISYWRKALEASPQYAPAKKRIDEVNHQLAQKQFEAGYLHYHHGDLEDALDSWQNAIALDPSYKQRGLLLLMSKVERSVRKEQVARLVTQAYDQYQQKEYDASLRSYEELLQLEPRHEEARRMSAKIKILLGQAAFKAAASARAQKRYADAIQRYQSCVQYGYEVQRSQKSIQEIEALLKKPRIAKPSKPPKTEVAKSTAAVMGPVVPPTPIDPVQAMVHYRQGLGAIKSRDFHRALTELKVAYQLDPSNEHIYIALQRAQQEWNAVQQNPAP
jgi:tetratricopeptide (TPR) repeat protein